MTIAPNTLVREIYETGVVRDLNETEIKVWAHISREHYDALYRTVLKYKPQRCIEIGMSCGLSTLAILTALREIDEGGQLISIDPYQSTDRKNIGVANVRRAGFEDIHTLMEEPDFTALPRLLEQGHQIQFSYIDGWHTFDYVLLDFFYLDKMTRPGGIVAFNDCGWKSINKVLRFMRAHRRYAEIDVGLTPNYLGRNFLYTMARRWLDFRWNDRYFRKEEDWEPRETTFYASF
jgi:predicted O-methyltransferase YrrM